MSFSFLSLSITLIHTPQNYSSPKDTAPYRSWTALISIPLCSRTLGWRGQAQRDQVGVDLMERVRYARQERPPHNEGRAATRSLLLRSDVRAESAGSTFAAGRTASAIDQ